MHRLGTQHCVAMGSPPIPGRSERPDLIADISTDEQIFGDMRELQSIGHGLLVTFCSCHRGPNRQGSPGHGTGICIRAEAPLVKSSQVSGSVVQRGSPAWRHCPGPFPPQGCTSVVWFPVWLPNGRKGAGIHMLSCAPTATRTRDLLLRRHSRGRHFAPFEEPELYPEELRAFFRPYRAATG